MERTKRKNVFRAELIIFLAVIAVSLLVCGSAGRIPMPLIRIMILS